MSRIGMNPDEVRALSGQIDGQLGVLDGAQAAVALAGVMSANPLQYLLAPGALILSPWSISQTSLASVEIINARASAQELVGKLLAEAGAQEWASSDLDALYFEPVAWRTPDASKVPVLDPADFFNPLNFIKDAVGTITDIWGYAQTAYEAAEQWVKPVFDKVKKWMDDLPPWVTKLGKFSKIVPWLGAGVTAVDLIIAISEGNVPGIIQNAGSLIIDGVSALLAPTGIGALIGAGVGILWDVAWEYGYNIAEIINDPMALYNYYQEYPWMAPVHFLIPLTVEIWGPLAD